VAVKETIRADLEAARVSFHALLDSLSEDDLRKKSNNPGWTNAEILFHMALGFMIVPRLAPLVRFFGRLPDRYSKIFAQILNRGTGLFNWVNALGARMGGKVYTGRRLARQYERTHQAILRLLGSIREDEWELGMYYPTRWDAEFGEYMTLKELFTFPISHYTFHLGQIKQDHPWIIHPGQEDEG